MAVVFTFASCYFGAYLRLFGVLVATFGLSGHDSFCSDCRAQEYYKRESHYEYLEEFYVINGWRADHSCAADQSIQFGHGSLHICSSLHCTDILLSWARPAA